MSAPVPERPALRIGTQEREAAYAALTAHLDAGRLDAEEYGERYAQASLARTRPDIDALFTDLPAPHPTFGPVGPTAAQPSWVTQPPPQLRLHPARLIRAVVLFIPIIAITLAVTTGSWFLFFAVPLAWSFFGRAAGRCQHRQRNRARSLLN